jgi:hypothetical protein
MGFQHATARAAALLLCLSACYTQHPLGAPVPEPGMRIIAQVTDSGTVAMANKIGSGALEVEGVVVAADADVWNLQLLRVDQRGGVSTSWNRELVSFPRYALANSRVKLFSRKRSWMTAGILTASAILAAKLFGAAGADEMPGGTPPPAF